VIVQDHVLPEDPEAARYIDAFERLRDPSHNRALSQSEWVNLFRQAGLVVDHVETLLKRHSFVTWTQRQDCSPETSQQLIDLIENAPSAVLDWLRPRRFGTPHAEFANHHIIIAGHRPAYPGT
jgi:hypothetical protein